MFVDQEIGLAEEFMEMDEVRKLFDSLEEDGVMICKVCGIE